jgi:ribosomal protein L40E
VFKILVIPLAMVLIGITIPFVYTNIVGVAIGAIVAGSSVFIFRSAMKSSISSINRHYETALTGILKNALVCPKCRAKWEVGAEKCAKCGFSAKMDLRKAGEGTKKAENPSTR